MMAASLSASSLKTFRRESVRDKMTTEAPSYLFACSESDKRCTFDADGLEHSLLLAHRRAQHPEKLRHELGCYRHVNSMPTRRIGGTHSNMV